MKRLGCEAVKGIFHHYLTEAGYKAGTIYNKMVHLKIFQLFLSKHTPDADFRDLGRETLLDFMKHLNDIVTERTGKPYSRRMKLMCLGTVRLVFRCLYQEELILTNPLQDLAVHPQGVESRRAIMTEEEMNAFLDGIDPDSEYGLRDRALFG